MALKSSSILVEQKPLVQPPLEALAKALNKGLTKNFAYVNAEVVDCPDLTKDPFNLAAEGLGGTQRIVEIGGVPYLMPLVKRNKIYEMKDINNLVGVEPAFIIGAGAGPHVYVALNKGLTKNFAYVNAEVVDCPDLTKDPFNLAAEGLGGTQRIVEIGGVPYLMPLVKRNKIYEMKDINNLVGVEPAFIIGAGAGPHVYVGKNSELVANMVISHGEVKNLCRIAKLKDETVNDDFEVEILPETETRCSLLANLYVSEGKPGKVLKIHCKKRTGKDDFVTAVKHALLEEFKKQPIGIGGAFLITGSKAKHHIMPDFSKHPILTDRMVTEWLKFYDFNPPLVAVGTLVTNDPGLDLRLQHFHSFGMHSEAGHYHIDTDPENVEYLAYFNTGSSVVRLDRPEETHDFGRD